jgi:hypothetical protein
MASVESIWQQVVEANRGVEGIYKGRAGATIQAANRFLATPCLEGVFVSAGGCK